MGNNNNNNKSIPNLLQPTTLENITFRVSSQSFHRHCNEFQVVAVSWLSNPESWFKLLELSTYKSQPYVHTHNYSNNDSDSD